MAFRLPASKRSAWDKVLGFNLAKGVEAAMRETGAAGYIKLSGNESRLGPSPKVQKVLAESFYDLSYYPDPQIDMVAERLAVDLEIAQEHIVTGCGLFEIISALALVVLGSGDKALVAKPSFFWYAIATHIAQAQCVELPLDARFANDLPALAATVDENTRLVWLCNPNNPTGAVFHTDELVDFLTRVPADVVVAVDEAYRDFVDDPDYPDTLALARRHPNLIVLRTFSKAHGLAGLRLGYAIGAPELTELIRRVKLPILSNALAGKAALASLDDPEYLAKVIRNNREGREAYYRVFDDLGLTYVPSQTNFVFFDTGIPSEQVAEKFLRCGIIVRPGTDFGYPTWLRVTIGTPEDNARVADILRELP
ncbi:MAG: histidinol-phosphate transaminase [Coriobacteriales bacterium]|nr:histidinol-phosphate transaminase [Coriobacteriales bacterium]